MKKFLSSVLAVLLLIVCLSIPAFADAQLSYVTDDAGILYDSDISALEERAAGQRPEPPVRDSCDHRRPPPYAYAEGADCRPPGELERVSTLSNFQSRPAACTVGTGRFLRRKIPFSREKIVSLQSPRPKNL